MVRYVDPETHPEGQEEADRRRTTPGERLARARERNAALTGAAAVEAAREVALRRLDARSCSRGELRQLILRRGFAPSVAEDVLDRLERVGLIDDTAYAAALVRDRFRSGKVGQAVAEELRRRDVGDGDIARAMAQVGRDDQYARAEALVAARLRSMRGIGRDAAFRRLTAMLARKGYPGDVCVSVVTEALNGRDAEDLA
ncbi:regulatory protein RecX [Schaalia naturae]|uniref:Regulatory protein RecX n=1 Tax=Schaalia naturae TaxID=635203 RepID=A0ABW2SLW1_9ACTO